MAAKTGKTSSKKSKDIKKPSRCGQLIWTFGLGIALLAVLAAVVTPRPGDLLPPVQNVQQETGRTSWHRQFLLQHLSTA
jgi:hypothetical protein